MYITTGFYGHFPNETIRKIIVADSGMGLPGWPEPTGGVRMKQGAPVIPRQPLLVRRSHLGGAKEALSLAPVQPGQFLRSDLAALGPI